MSAVQNSVYDVLVVGGGAAGLFCANRCAKQGNRVLLLEHNPSCGRKILVSGGGRCNFTNLTVEFSDYQSSNSHFFKSALTRFAPSDFISLVEAYAIPFYEKKKGQLFCKGRAQEILDMLLEECRKSRVEIICNVPTELKVDKQDLFKISGKDLSFESRNLVLATGGKSFPKIGATDWGYRIAKQFGHKIVPTTPALVGLRCKNFEGLSGSSLKVRISVSGKVFEEDMLFTHTGISGPVVLRASLEWNAGDCLTIDFLPDMENFSIETIRKVETRKTLGSFLRELLPKRLAELCSEDLGWSAELTLSDLSKFQIEKLENWLKRYDLTIVESEGFHRAEVTKGGISTDEISSKTLESQKEKGLYFVGELLDVTGQLGGFNFQWAWASAAACAQAITEKKD